MADTESAGAGTGAGAARAAGPSTPELGNGLTAAAVSRSSSAPVGRTAATASPPTPPAAPPANDGRASSTSPGDGRPPRAPRGSFADDSSGARRSSSGWRTAKGVLTAVSTAAKFTTLRDLIGTDAYIEPARLKKLKTLGAGAFAKVQHAELWLEGETPQSNRSGATPFSAGKPGDGGAASPATGGGGKERAGVQEVAVKTLHRQLLEDPEQVQLFVKEVGLLRKLRHRYIVGFIGTSWQQQPSGGAQPEELYYVQEYCPGGSLADLVRKQMIMPFKPLYSDADALRWSLNVALALQYLHEARPTVIHRDLKLDNVMISSTDTSVADAKLGDFGLARLMKPEEKQKIDRLTRLLSVPKKTWDPALQASSKSLEVMLDKMITSKTTSTQASAKSIPTSGRSAPPSMLHSSATTYSEVSNRELTGRTGSFGYMAPEVSRSQQYNAQADIFSLGMCMYCLFNRTIPTLQIMLNGDESQLELYAAKVADGYRPPCLPTLAPSVKDAIEACWKGSADLRPDARGVVQMLEKIRDSGECGAKGGDPHMSSPGGCACCSIM